jgi:hypothetical protein
VVFRADAAFAKPEIYEAPAIRIPSNDSLERELLPAGRQTELQARGLVQGLSVPGRELEDSAPGGGQVEFHFGELFPRVGFIVTNLETDKSFIKTLKVEAGRRDLRATGSEQPARRRPKIMK